MEYLLRKTGGWQPDRHRVADTEEKLAAPTALSEAHPNLPAAALPSEARVVRSGTLQQRDLCTESTQAEIPPGRGTAFRMPQ